VHNATHLWRRRTRMLGVWGRYGKSQRSTRASRARRSGQAPGPARLGVTNAGERAQRDGRKWTGPARTVPEGDGALIV
jgi:hypothetical protein